MYSFFYAKGNEVVHAVVEIGDDRIIHGRWFYHLIASFEPYIYKEV